jgi:hypothetical protein
MYSNSSSYPTVSHLVNLSPDLAAGAFDVMILDPAFAQRLITAGPLRKAQPLRYDALRVLPAMLSVGRRKRATISVALELLPWSDHRSELSLRSVNRSRLRIGPGVAQYRAAAVGALEVLAGLLESRQVGPGRGAGWAAVDPGLLIGAAPAQRGAGAPAIDGRHRSA